MTTPAPPVYNGRYELRRQIGRGGTAQVYLAHDLLLDRPVALKVLMSELSRDRSFVDRFRREAQAAANLTHPNIVSVFDWGESGETYFIVMEYIDGESLASIIRTQAPLEPVQAASIGADISAALSYAHRHGVVHRDVKPGNVLITADGQVKVTDFGIARAIGSDDQITQTGLVMGTATYFSPEQAQGQGVDGRSDVYSLGVVLYEMVVGRPPFHGENPVSIAYQHVREEPQTPRSQNSEVPLELEAIILQAIAKRPADRYQTADELRADLARFVHGQTVLARPPAGATGDLTQAVAIGSGTGAETVAFATIAASSPAPPADIPIGPPPSRSTTPWWVAAGALLLVGILLIGYFVGRDLGYFGAAAYYRVPDVTGTQLVAAQDALRAHHLEYTPVATPGDGTHVNEVFDQDPKPNSTVRSGTKVTLDYYTLPHTAQIPDVRAEAVKTAQANLKAAGLRSVVHLVPASSSAEVQGTVIAMSPAPGMSVPRNSEVTLEVAHGTSDIKIPNVVGDDPATAGSVLGNAGLEVSGTSSGGYSATVAQGNVVATAPAVGTLVAPHTSVELKLSRGIGVVIPDTVGEPVSVAETTLSVAGVTSTPTQSCVTVTNSAQYGFVQSQFPKYTPNSYVSPTHPVILYVGCPSNATTTTAPTTTTTTTVPGSADTTPTTTIP